MEEVVTSISAPPFNYYISDIFHITKPVIWKIAICDIFHITSAVIWKINISDIFLVS